MNKRKPYEQKAFMIRAETHRAIQLFARYFGCTQSEFVQLLMYKTHLLDNVELKPATLKRFDEHLELFNKTGKRRPGLQEFLNMLKEDE